MTEAVGLDLGSTWAKRVRLVDGDAMEREALPSHRYHEMLDGVGEVPVGACGYFRDRAAGARTCTEVTAALLGTRHFFPDIEVVVDVGGQDVKVVDARTGELRMNDKCGAGTGAFLEFACAYLGVVFKDLGALHRRARNPAEINDACGVFALTGMVSALADGASVADVVAGLHRAFARRVAPLVPPARRVAMVGGVARDAGAVAALSDELGHELSVPPHPQHCNAVGAALFAIRGGVRLKNGA